MELPKIMAVIPARYGSSRFPGKVIAPIAGRPLVAHVYDQTRKSKLVSDVVIATDDVRVRDALEPLGIPSVMTRPDHPSGTDRIAEVARQTDAAIVVNVQGDEPLIDPHTIDAAIQPLLEDPDVSIATARRRITNPADIDNPNVVKVVCGLNGRALYFSRCPIPHVRDGQAALPCHWQHIGLYAYRRAFLLAYAAMPVTPLEELEKLEQLRALERGHAIVVVDTDYQSIGVDTPEDLEHVSKLIAESQRGAR
ncbi:MAG TPA: 3-deoxy-manno-octulosonate cytidylyltransferase [Candidatus Hydrogenedentes bacterium]|nr:3-deoxy-manno-octulosonate cytidylyltransferase [Candidatus Hydrogenedentota bacterium]HOS02612.1 3-deoxy-manno-octulosonate cytidylyltransferase [Candidatus Hydrogenedentota bacterium]